MEETRVQRLSRSSRSKRRKKDKKRSRIALLVRIGVSLAILAAFFTIWNVWEPGGNQPASDPGYSLHFPNDSGKPGADAGTAQDSEPNGGTGSELNDPQQQPADGGHAGDGVDSSTPGDAAEAESVLLAFVGDVMLGGNVGKMLEQEGYNYPYVHIGDYLRKADMTLGNLENPITERGEAADKSFVFRASPRALPELAGSGFDVFNLANNHTLDYGWEGLEDTRNYLSQAGVQHVGSGVNIEEAYSPVIVERNGIRIASLGFSRVVPDGTWKATANRPGLAETYDYRPAVAAIAKAKEQADIVVVMVHWGQERKDEPEHYQRQLAWRYIDAGADLVVGSHAHVLQGIESYKGKWVAYSLGNFIFTVNADAGTQHTAILQAECGPAGDCELQLIPFRLGVAQPVPVGDNEAAELFSRLDKLSYHATIDRQGRVASLLDE